MMLHDKQSPYCHGLQKHTFFSYSQVYVLARKALFQMVGELGEAAAWVRISASCPRLKKQQLLGACFSQGISQGCESLNQITKIQ